jgi:CRISPR-associated protein Csm3
MFESLQSKVVIRGRLRVETGLRIGTGRAAPAGGSDLPVMRDARGMPFIPGSSLKGVVRAWAESLLRGMADSPEKMQKLACDPLRHSPKGAGAAHSSDLNICVDPGEVAEWQRRPEPTDTWCKDGEVEGFTRPLDERQVSDVLRRRLCCTCRVFGHQALASPVLFADLPLAAGDPLHVVAIRDGVAIDRDTGTVSGGLKYDYEVVQGGTEFDLEIAAENLEPWQRGLLLLCVQALQTGEIRVGGAKSRGLGMVRLMGKNGSGRPEILLYEPGDIDARIQMAVGRLEPAPVEVEGDVAQRWMTALAEEIERRLSDREEE